MCSLLAAAGVAVFSFAAQAQSPTAKASLKDATGKDVGNVQLLQTPHGVLLKMSLKDNFITAWVKENGVGGIDDKRMTDAIEQIAVTYDFKNPKPKSSDLFSSDYLPPATERKL
jgi:hypothetical protein